MRIIIKGEITVDSLMEALQVANDEYAKVRPGHKIYGANLYVTAFDADGSPFDLADDRGKSLVISIEAKSGKLVRPALTAEGEKSRLEFKQNVKLLDAEAEAKAMARHRKASEEYEREHQERREKEAQAKKQFEDVNAITAECLKNMPERFVSDLNKTVQGVWHDLKPVEPHGKRKGQLRALPVFSIHAGELLLTSETRKSPLRVLNPVFTLQSGKLASFWRHDAWEEAMKQIITKVLAHSDNAQESKP